MLELLRAHFGQEKIQLTDDFHRDLNWFLKFLPTFNGVSFFKHISIQATIELDACLQGLGAVCNNQIYAIKIPPNFQNYTIVHLEMLNELVAVRLWRYYWKQKSILIKCDNQAVVSVLTSGRTQDRILAAIARNILLELAVCDIKLKVIHVLGKDNPIADLLSRWFITANPHQKFKNFLSCPEWLHPHPNITDISWFI